MIDFVLRAVGMYFVAMIIIRVLGKRALGEMGPFDFVIMIGVAHMVVTIFLEKSIPYFEGLVILTTLVILEYLMGYIAIKSSFLSNLITGKPVTLIDNGKIIKENLAKEKFNVDDLMQELRKQGVRDIDTVERGVLESCGGFSVIIKNEDQSVTCRDLGIKKDDEKGFLTVADSSRAEIFALNDEEFPEKSFDLRQSVNNIEERLAMIDSRLEKIENNK